ncbi:DNA topoisomerase 2-binding protein 1 isoform X2 [Tribolium castaneum]|uniref:DNA topoisomerase 2-binding protein 1 isoform X2 n=1 Tax=Tribolium castaneum TaxID=7070 RepID=UPI00046BF081|nr:PREDICTED: DNA topoisomerase 2-binding protein 1 isoform X2 [Tribolium castaneum]|eukprot:XP_008190279.1 PREDICTED: DNA topoisomerase 2-binding protein 1 isoform X2 [Tribolium castaneum]
MDKIRVLFILPANCKDQSEASDIMLQAYESCKQNVVNVSWVEEANFSTIDFSKTDFVVFQDFEGKNFESLKESKCAILGPWCLLVCLMDGRPIPNYTWPIYNVAMAGCVVSCSHIPKARKLEIKEKVQLMGGCCTDQLMSTNTHLITESVKSEKYLQAAERGLKLMVSQWVEAVWEESQTNNIHCDDEKFKKYRCLPFHNLIICSTGFPNTEMRAEAAQNVAKNGGIFTASLTVAKTDVLIVYGVGGVLSKKYKAARAHSNIYCVSIDWLNDSIEKGYALPHALYTVKKGTSTPTKEDETCPDFSIISAIGESNTTKHTMLEETVMAKKVQPSFLTTNRISQNKRKCAGNEEMGRIIDGLDIKKAKMAGQYLDGCSVYLAGFKPDQREKLAKILNLSGATRYDDISDRLTHIIVGDTSCPEVKIVRAKNYSVSLVSIHWLLTSMEQQQAADEENYLINLHDSDREQFSSPLGRKGLTLLRSSKTLTSNDLEAANVSATSPCDAELESDALMKQYRKTVTNDDTDSLMRLIKDDSKFNLDALEGRNSDVSSQNSDQTNQDTNVFIGKKFLLVNFPVDESQFLKEQIEGALGTIMPKTYKGIPDYVVAPNFIKTPIQTSALETVNSIWVCESIHESDEVPIAYYHRPFVICDSAPLENCVVTISGYSSFERNFLKELIEALGGTSQEQFARVLCVEKNLQASTHLVSFEADGKKYAAAVKWGLPVVTKNWLFECAKSGKRVPEDEFLVGEAKAPTRPVLTSSKQFTPISMSGGRKMTPLSQIQPLDISTSEKTPTNPRVFNGVVETPDPCSQVTPINKLMEEVRKTNLLGTPQTPPMPKTWYDVDTPESPFGAFIRPHLSPKSKKELMRYINRIPDFVPPPQERKSTPLSEVKRRCWRKLLGQQGQDSPISSKVQDEACASRAECEINDENSGDDVKNSSQAESVTDNTSEANTQNLFVNTKLREIEDMVRTINDNRRKSRPFQSEVPAEVGSSAVKDSQPFTVGWDYNEEPPIQQVRIFMISGMSNEERQAIVTKIEALGGQVSDLNSFDPKCTHLICPKPARNEKTLSCMASGKWILHASYVDKCASAGKFLPEEEFEFGNPKARDNIKVFDKENEFKMQSVHWWRREIKRRGYGAFHDMRAIVVAQKKEPIVRVIEAGGGQVLDVAPPFKENVHATHCLLEIKSVPDFSAYLPLAQQGILCLNTLYISDFLYRTNKDVKDAIIPHFTKFYT